MKLCFVYKNNLSKNKIPFRTLLNSRDQFFFNENKYHFFRIKINKNCLGGLYYKFHPFVMRDK